MRKPKNLARQSAKVLKRQKFYIFCEGTNTEPEYIEKYNVDYCRASIEVIFGEGGADPKALVERAEKKLAQVSSRTYRREFGDRDQVWVAFDRDDHEHFDKSVTRATSVGISVAYSNPCFELWLVLHCIDYSSSQDRHALQDKCEEVCPGYNKERRKVPDLPAILPHVYDAEKRAEKLRASCRASGSDVPYTTVDQLTRALRLVDEIEGHLFSISVIDGQVFLVKTGHSSRFSVDVEGLNSANIIHASLDFIKSRSAAVGSIPTRLKRTRNLDQAVFAVVFLSTSDFDKLQSQIRDSDVNRIVAFEEF
jgi:hypothetical protein